MRPIHPGRLGSHLLIALVCGTWLAPGAQAQGTAPAEASIADVVEAVAPSVVTVTVERDADKVEGFLGNAYGGVSRGAGSGVVLAKGGWILTNHHVIENARWIGVELHDGRKLEAKLVGFDVPTDLALIRVGESDLPAVPFADSDAVRPGDRVLALGAPFGLKHSVTAGVISATGRRRTSHGVTTAHLQTDAQINPGNSGGPLLDAHGRIVGINSAYLGGGTGIGFAIPANLARRVGRELERHGRVERGYAGLHAQSLTRELADYFQLKGGHGALVTQVDVRAPAAQAGLRPGDIVIAFGGSPVTDADALLDRIGQAPIGSKQGLLFMRAGKRLGGHIAIASTPAEPPGRPTDADDDAPMLGLQVRTLTRALRAEFGYRGQGSVVITAIMPGSPADRAGLVPGIVILEADLQPVQRAGDLLAATEDERALLRAENSDGEVAYVLLQRKPR